MGYGNRSLPLSVMLLSGMLALGVSACSVPNKPMTKAAAEMSEPMSSGEILEVMRTVNMAEIRHARLAIDRTDNHEVREVARLMIQDHTASNRRIAEVARATDVQLKESALSKGVKAQAEELADELAELSGSEFDRAFLQKQAEMHQVIVDTVQKDLLPNAEDRQVREFLVQATPKLERHKNQSQESFASLNRSGTG